MAERTQRKGQALRITGFVISALLLLYGVWLNLVELQFRGWESFMKGPYSGVELVGRTFTGSSSSIDLPGDFRLSVYPDVVRTNDVTWPALVMYSPAGEQVWARLLQPEQILTVRTKLYPLVRDVRLERVKKSNEGYKIVLSCFWGGGGAEGGIIYLNRDYKFEGFSLSW